MTKVIPEELMSKEAILLVSADVSFALNRFPKYRIGPNNQIVVEEGAKGPTLKTVVAQETTQLSEQQKRLSVRDLAIKFDNNLTAAVKFSAEAKIKEVASLEGHVLLKKLRDALESLRGRLAGRNKEDVERAISMVEALAVRLTQEEGELIQEKFEVKQLANFLKQASEDAKKLVNQERCFACAEIESARAVVQRFGEALDEQQINSHSHGKQGIHENMEEVQEARRIKMLHQPIKVMDMEHELHELRIQIQEKSIFSAKLQRELIMKRGDENNKSCIYMINGSEVLGSCLQLKPRLQHLSSQLAKSAIQWYRLSSEATKRDLIAGACKSTYAPEPLDVGRILQADINANGQRITVTTARPIDPAPGLESYVETLTRKPNAEFRVVISEINHNDNSSKAVHTFHVGTMRMKLCRGWITKARESYSSSMQIFGGNGGAKALYWQAKKGLSYTLAFESERGRNAAILLARKFALECNVVFAGTDDS